MGSLNPDEVPNKQKNKKSKQEYDSGFFQDDTVSKPAMESKRSTSLLDLSDDVLLYILKDLNAHDLKSLGFTCARLGTLVLDHTLWVHVDGGDTQFGRKRLRWMLQRALLGPHTRSLRVKGYATEAAGCSGLVTRLEKNEADEGYFLEEERYLCDGLAMYKLAQSIPRCDNRFPFWRKSSIASQSENLAPLYGRPTQYADRPVTEPLPGLSQPSPAGCKEEVWNQPSASNSHFDSEPSSVRQEFVNGTPSTSEPMPSTSEAMPSTSEPMLSTSKPIPSTSEPIPFTSKPIPSTSEPMTTSEPNPSTSGQHASSSKPMPSTSEPKPSTSEPKPSTSEPKPSTSEPKPSTSEPKPSTSEPKPSTSEPKPSTSESKPSTSEPMPSTSGQHDSTAETSKASPAPEPQPFQSRTAGLTRTAARYLASRNPRFATPLSYSTSNTSCPGPQLTLTHTGMSALTNLCTNLTSLELAYCVIDCQTMNIGHFPKSLQRLSLIGTKCYNVQAKSFLFKIQDHLVDLEEIDVSYCSWIDPASMLPLSKMPKLLRVAMRECEKLTEFVAYASLATRYGFKKLKVFDLRGSPVGDSEVAALGWLPALEELYLSPAPEASDVPEHAHYRQDKLPEFKELDDWEETDPEYYKVSEIQEAEWTQDEENGLALRPPFSNFDDPYANSYRSFMAIQSPPGFSLFIRRAHERAQEEMRQRQRRNSSDEPGPSGESKPGTSGQKRKPEEKNADSSSDDDDDNSPSKVPVSTRTIATQTGKKRSSQNNGQGPGRSKKTKTTCTPQQVFEITVKETSSHADAQRANNNMEAAANNNRPQNAQDPTVPVLKSEPMDVDVSTDNQNPINKPGPSKNTESPIDSEDRNRKIVFLSHREATECNTEAEIENRNETEVQNEEDKKPNVGSDTTHEGIAGPSNNAKNRQILILRHEDCPEAVNQAESAHIKTENIEAGSPKNETSNGNNQASRDETEKNKADKEKATDETEKANGAENKTNESKEENKESKGAENQTVKQNNGVEQIPLTPEEAERNRINDRIMNVLDESVYLRNHQSVSYSFSHSAQALIASAARAEPRRSGNRLVNIQQLINDTRIEATLQNTPRGVLFAGLIPARLDYSSLVSDSSIRRFGRALGENILYLGGGVPVAGIGSARPDRSNLRILSVTGFRHVTDSTLMHLTSAAPNLQTLDLTGTGVTARGARSFRAQRPDVTLVTDHPEEHLELD